jgi:hypothetical protein
MGDVDVDVRRGIVCTRIYVLTTAKGEGSQSRRLALALALELGTEGACLRHDMAMMYSITHPITYNVL